MGAGSQGLAIFNISYMWASFGWICSHTSTDKNQPARPSTPEPLTLKDTMLVELNQTNGSAANEQNSIGVPISGLTVQFRTFAPNRSF